MAARRTRFALSLVLAASLLLTSAGFAQAAAVIKATSAHRWNPASTSVSKGTKVVWKNPTTLTHTVTAYKGSWSKNVTLRSGASTSFVFNSAGTFKFRCTIHSTLSNGVCSGMCGKVVVT
jgi:plastocyanin